MGIRYPFRRFARDEAGTISVESVIIFPILLWAFAAMFVYFDAFKSQNVNVKATYTVADLISRQANPIDAQFVNGMNNVYGYLIRSGDENDIIVSVVSMGLASDGQTPELQLRWSYATGNLVAFNDVSQIAGTVPIMAVGDQLIVVHSRMRWSPRLNFGLNEMVLNNVAFTRPRFVPQVVWQGGGASGTGNGSGSIYIASADDGGAYSDGAPETTGAGGAGLPTGTGGTGAGDAGAGGAAAGGTGAGGSTTTTTTGGGTTGGTTTGGTGGGTTTGGTGGGTTTGGTGGGGTGGGTTTPTTPTAPGGGGRT